MKASEVRCQRKGCNKPLVDVAPDFEFGPRENVDCCARSVHCEAGHRSVISAVRKGQRVEFHMYSPPDR